MSAIVCDVVIVGAGPTGLTLANFLGQAGRNVVLVERNTSTVGEPRAVSIDDEALRTMQAIGLSSEVVRNVALDYGSHYFSATGTRFVAVEPTTREYGFPRRNAFVQPKLEATLRQGLRRFASVTTLFGHECVDFEDAGGGVSAHLRGLSRRVRRGQKRDAKSDRGDPDGIDLSRTLADRRSRLDEGKTAPDARRMRSREVLHFLAWSGWHTAIRIHVAGG